MIVSTTAANAEKVSCPPIVAKKIRRTGPPPNRCKSALDGCLLVILETQHEIEVEPDCMSDHRREPVTLAGNPPHDAPWPTPTMSNFRHPGKRVLFVLASDAPDARLPQYLDFGEYLIDLRTWDGDRRDPVWHMLLHSLREQRTRGEA